MSDPDAAPWAREEILHQANLVVAETVSNGGATWIGHEADRIVREYPESGMRAEELISVLVGMAVDRRLPFDTSR